MDPKFQRQKHLRSLLGAAIHAMDIAKEVSSATPAQVVFGTVIVLLRMIRVRFLSDDAIRAHP